MCLDTDGKSKGKVKVRAVGEGSPHPNFLTEMLSFLLDSSWAFKLIFLQF